MMKHWKRYVIPGGIGLLVVGGIAFAFLNGGESAEAYVTEVAARSTLAQSVEATGEVASLDDVDLAFETSGTVASVYVGVGDAVTAGTLLAMLDSDELSASVSEAANAVAEAEANLQLKRAGSTVESISVAEAGVAVASAAADAAAVSLVSADSALTFTTTRQEAAVAQAQTELDSTITTNALENAQALTDVVTVLQGNVIAVRSALSEADETLGIDNSLGNNDFEDVLSALDFQAMTDATNAYEEATLSRDNAEDMVYALPLNATEAEVEAAVDAMRVALEDASLTLLYTRRVLDATVVDTADFSFEDLEALKAGVDSQRTLVQAEQEALEGQWQTYETTVTTNVSTQAAAETALALAQATQASEVARAEADVAAAQAALASREADVQSAEARLAEVQAGPRRVDLAAYEAAVARARSQLAAASARLDETRIISPIDGIVTRLDIDPGEQVATASAVITVQTTEEDLFKVVVDVSESDIADISLNDEVEMTFDAFGEDIVVPGFVKEIDPAEKLVEGVVFYEVTILLEEETSVSLKPGMSADVTIWTARLEHVITVPQRAVLERDTGEKYVRIPRGSTYEERAVTVGLRGDGGRVEIIQGIDVGETIIVSIRQ